MTGKFLWLDRLGICLSVCCGIHCLATSVFFAVGALEAWGLLENERFESAITLGVFIVGMMAILPQLIIHRNYGLTGFFVFGFVVLRTSESMTIPWMQSSMLIAGVLMIVGAHYFNIRIKRKHARYTKTAKETAGNCS